MSSDQDSKAAKVSAAVSRLKKAQPSDVAIASLALRDSISNMFRGTSNAAFGASFIERHVPFGKPLSDSTEALIDLMLSLSDAPPEHLRKAVRFSEEVLLLRPDSV